MGQKPLEHDSYAVYRCPNFWLTYQFVPLSNRDSGFLGQHKAPIFGVQ